MFALVFVMTYVPKVPIGPGGYVHLGDAAIYATSFLFGPVVGFFAAAFGTTFSDLAAGYGSYTPGTFVIHGLQGLVAAVIGGAIVVGGYFLYQWLVLREGIGPAGAALWPNTFQVLRGGILGVLLTTAVLRAYPPAASLGQRPTWTEEEA